MILIKILTRVMKKLIDMKIVFRSCRDSRSIVVRLIKMFLEQKICKKEGMMMT